MSLKCLALTLFLCILGIEILHWYTAGLLLYAKNHVSTFQGISISRDMRTTRLPICAHRQPSHGQGTWCPPLELLQTTDPLGNIAPPYDNTGANLTTIPFFLIDSRDRYDDHSYAHHADWRGSFQWCIGRTGLPLGFVELVAAKMEHLNFMHLRDSSSWCR